MMSTPTYKIRDLPLSIDDACQIEAAQETRSIRAMRPFIEKYLILDDGQTLGDLPLSDLGAILGAILKRAGVDKSELKT